MNRERLRTVHHGDDAGDSLFGDDGGDGLLSSGCATATAEAQPRPVYMLVVLDGSGSMADQNKWVSVVPALGALFDDLANRGDTSTALGLTVFSDTGDPSGGSGTYTKIDVPIAIVDGSHAAALHARLQGQPAGLTPTFAALSGQYPQLEAFAPSDALPAGGARVLVLMTDGVPNGGAPEQAQCTAIAKSEAAKGVETFAVGIGNLQPPDPSQYDPLFMAQVAIAGGTATPGCDPSATQDESRMCHFQVTPGGKSAQQLEQALVAALARIRGAIASCEFALQKSAQDIDPTKVNVVYTDGSGKQTLVPQDDNDGWTYDDPSAPAKVILHGSACAQLESDPGGKIRIVVGCATVTR